VCRELTTDRVINMSYLEGDSLGDWLKRKPSRELRHLVGARLCEIYETQLQALKVLHADQHPGNWTLTISLNPKGRSGRLVWRAISCPARSGAQESRSRRVAQR
jgi:predicted unusual protein kinase regulating ubiquinone biosynthesis (AarF/ABC1/UbiB family)